MLDILAYEAGSFYVTDRAYIDFARLYEVHLQKAFFVVRAKENMRFKRTYSATADRTKGVKYDQIDGLEGHYSKKDYPEKLRRIKYHDSKTEKEFVFLTDNTDLNATEIAMPYKKRWEAEPFFKWMKQHLRIRSFWGTGMDAVKIQVHCAIIAYCLVAIIGNKLESKRRIYEIL